MKKGDVALVLIIISFVLGVLLVTNGYPDWSRTVLPYKDAVFSVTGDVDANITNSSIDVNVTNSKLDVDANITNSSIDVNVTNSSLNVNVQGTADVEIQNAEVNVKNLREQASELGNVDFAYDESGAIDGGGGTYSATLYTNNGTSNVYLEMVSAAFLDTAPGSTTYSNIYVLFKIDIYKSDGTVKARFYVNPGQILSFDPAIPLAPGEYIKYEVVNYADQGWAYVSALIRT